MYLRPWGATPGEPSNERKETRLTRAWFWGVQAVGPTAGLAVSSTGHQPVGHSPSLYLVVGCGLVPDPDREGLEIFVTAAVMTN